MAMFQGAGVNAIASIVDFFPASNSPKVFTLTHTMISGTTSATTFRIRVGSGDAQSMLFNEDASGALMGGTMALGIVVYEYGV